MDSLDQPIVIEAFDEEFSVPRSNLGVSETLSRGLNGNFREHDRISLQLDPDLRNAFGVIHAYLLDPTRPLPKMSLFTLGSVLYLADYLDIPTLRYLLVEEISRHAKEGEYLPLLLQFPHLPEVRPLIQMYLHRKGSYWNDLSSRLQATLRPFFDQDVMTSMPSPLGLRIIPTSIDQRKILSLMPRRWAKVCQKNNHPEVIRDVSIIPTLILNGKNFARLEDDQGNGHYITGPGNKQIGFFDLDGRQVPCAGTKEIEPILNPEWGHRQAVMTDQGWIALINPNFVLDTQGVYKSESSLRLMKSLGSIQVNNQRFRPLAKSQFSGDFVLIWDPIILPTLRLIIDPNV